MQAQFAAIRTRFDLGTGVDFGSRQNGERGEILVAGGGGEFPFFATRASCRGCREMIVIEKV